MNKRIRGLPYQGSWPSITSIASIQKHRYYDLLLQIYNLPTKHYKDKQSYLWEKLFSFNPFSPHYPLSHPIAHNGLIHQMYYISAYNIFAIHNGFALQIIAYFINPLHTSPQNALFHNFVSEQTLGQTQHPSKLLLATFLDLD